MWAELQVLEQREKSTPLKCLLAIISKSFTHLQKGFIRSVIKKELEKLQLHETLTNWPTLQTKMICFPTHLQGWCILTKERCGFSAYITGIAQSRMWGIVIRDTALFHCGSMKYDLMFRWITMEYAVSRVKMPHVLDSAISVLSTFKTYHGSLKRITGLGTKEIKIPIKVQLKHRILDMIWFSLCNG